MRLRYRGVRTCAWWVTASILTGGGARAGTWVADNAGLRNLTVVGVGISPSDPNIIYIQARSLGVYKSTNGGQNWSKTATFNYDQGPGFDHLLHQGPVVHQTDPNTVWVASAGQVYKTTNGGASWFLSSAGTTVNGCNGVRGITPDPNDPNHLFAGTIISGCDGGVFESVNGGSTWTNIAGSAVGGGMGNDAWPIAIDASNVSRLYCGSPHNSVYRSTDGGHTWVNSPPVTGDASSYEVVINPLVPSQIWASAGTGTWVSADYGVTWARQTQLFNNAAIAAMRFAPSNPQVVYAIVGSTIWRSLDNGMGWTPGAIVSGGPRCIEIDPANPNVVYVGTWGLGMYKSTDGGQTFAEINSGLPLTSLIHGQQAFAVDDVRYCILTGNVMYRRPAGQANWEYYSVAPGNFIRVDRYRPNRWYCAGGGLWRSLDYGLTWQQVYTEGGATSVFGFWLDPRSCNRVLIGDANGGRVLRSDDGGDTWTVKGTVNATPLGFNQLSDLSGDPFDPNVMLVAAYPTYVSNRHCGYIWRSTDAGATWTQIRDQMFYRHWRVGDGGWQVVNYVMQQWVAAYCSYRATIDNQMFGDGYYQCRMRVMSSANNDPTHWVGFMIRLATPDHNFGDSGWLVLVRKNGEVALYNKHDGSVLSVPGAVADSTQWHTYRLNATGNTLEVLVDGQSVGTYVDANHRFDGAGYFGFTMCQASGEFDDLAINAGDSYTDGFDVPAAYGASTARWIACDPHNPGVFAVSTQGGGVWRTADHGATWQRITDTTGEGKVNYRPMISSAYSGNIYACRGSGYSWTIDNFHSQGTARQTIGQTLSYGSLVLGEDPLNAQRLFAAVYAQGILVYEAGDIVGEPAPPIPVRMDFDEDGDVDQTDFGCVQTCLSPIGVPPTDPACRIALLDEDPDVDAADLSIFLHCMRGPGVEPDPACDCPTP